MKSQKKLFLGKMKEILDAARSCDFITAKEIYDTQVSHRCDALSVLNETDRLGKSVAHYAAEYDEVIVVEWLYNMGCDLFKRDNNNRSPVEIAVMVDAKLRRKGRGVGEVLPFLKRVVLNPIQQIFYLESIESTNSVSTLASIENLSDNQLAETFPYYNNMQAIHVFAAHNRVAELEYIKSRGLDMTTVDDDGNNILHFASSPEVLVFGISSCGLDVNSQNTSDGNTPAHMIVERIESEDIDETVGISMIEELIQFGADLSIKCDSYSMGVTELALYMLGKSKLVHACMKSSTSLNGESLESYMETHAEDFESDSDLSVASHNDKVINENDNEDSESEDHSESDSIYGDEGCTDSSPSENEDQEEEFFIRSRK
jgi:hypothetical protein